MENPSNFHFDLTTHGHHIVSYISPKTNKKISKMTDNSKLVLKIKNVTNPKQKDLRDLKKFIKS